MYKVFEAKDFLGDTEEKIIEEIRTQFLLFEKCELYNLITLLSLEEEHREILCDN